MARARVDEDVALGIGSNPRDFAEIKAGGQLNRVGDGIEIDLRRRVLGERGGRKESASEGDRQDVQGGVHGCPPGYCAPPLVAVGDLRISFCTRHDSISPTMISFGLRQSIICTTWKPGATLPGRPNLPTTLPSSSTL